MSLHKKKWNVLLLLRISTTSSFVFFFLRLDEKEERYSSLSSQPSPSSSWSQRTKKPSLSLSLSLSLSPLSLLFFVCLFSPYFFVCLPFPCTHSQKSPKCALTRVLKYALKESSNRCMDVPKKQAKMVHKKMIQKKMMRFVFTSLTPIKKEHTTHQHQSYQS